MKKFATALCLGMIAGNSVVDAASANALRSKNAGSSFIATLQFKRTLRVCNAYPYSYPMDVFIGKERLTETAMPYKSCSDFFPNLKAGDKIDFRVGDSNAGTFSVSDVPDNDAVLVLVIYRHDTLSTSVSFESHVFPNLLNAQVAVLDTYRGALKSVPHIRDAKMHPDTKQERSEELRYNSVVAVNQGLYEVVLKDLEGKTKAQQELVAINRESYLVIRCGVEAEQGQVYPQELMVFPHSDPRRLSGAASTRPILGAVFAVLLAAVASRVGA